MNFNKHLIDSNLLSFRIQSINHNKGKIFLVVSLSGNVYHYSFIEIIGFNKKSYAKEQKQDEITYFKQLKPQEMINELYQRIDLQKININRLARRLNDLGWHNDAQEIRNLYLSSVDNFNLKAIFKEFIDDNFLRTVSKYHDYSWTNFYNLKKDYLLNKVNFQMKIKNITTEHKFELSGFKLAEL